MIIERMVDKILFRFILVQANGTIEVLEFVNRLNIPWIVLLSNHLRFLIHQLTAVPHSARIKMDMKLTLH